MEREGLVLFCSLSQSSKNINCCAAKNKQTEKPTLLASVSNPHKNPLKQHPAILQIASYGRVDASRRGVIHQLAEVLCFTWNMGRQGEDL